MQQGDLSTDFFNFHDNFPLSVDTLIDPFFDQDEFFYWESYNEYPPCFSPFSDSLIFPAEEFNSCNQLPKRQRIYEDHYLSNFPNDILSGYLPSPVPLPELMVRPPEFSTGGTAVRKQNGGSLSAQSIAARERRRKITEKTQELGKLIPGGNKMNTAEMFQAAFKYVKYLQAQVGILQSMGSCQVTLSALFYLPYDNLSSYSVLNNFSTVLFPIPLFLSFFSFAKCRMENDNNTKCFARKKHGNCNNLFVRYRSSVTVFGEF